VVVRMHNPRDIRAEILLNRIAQEARLQHADIVLSMKLVGQIDRHINRLARAVVTLEMVEIVELAAVTSRGGHGQKPGGLHLQHLRAKLILDYYAAERLPRYLIKVVKLEVRLGVGYRRVDVVALLIDRIGEAERVED